MVVKAVKSFSGVRFNMHAGEVREVENTETVQELLRIGYLENAEFGMRNAELNETPEQSAPENTEVRLNETKRGKSKRN